MYELVTILQLGEKNAGLTLKARLFDISSQQVGGDLTDGFAEIAGGDYVWRCDQFPDGFRGHARIYNAADDSYFLACAINPQDGENLDARVSGVLAGDIDSTGSPITARKAIETILAVACGQATYDSQNGLWSVKGRDGRTAIVTVTLSGGGNRTASTIA